GSARTRPPTAWFTACRPRSTPSWTPRSTAPSSRAATGAAQAEPIDNSALAQPGFRAHQATYGVVYRLPAEVNAILDAKVNGTLKQ
ncbi:hypothetical protein CTI14_66430, partial [Methylobacterium radiotolerans]